MTSETEIVNKLVDAINRIKAKFESLCESADTVRDVVYLNGSIAVVDAESQEILTEAQAYLERQERKTPEVVDESPFPSEAERQKRWRDKTDHLPPLPKLDDGVWLWTDNDIEMLRAAMFARFGESVRTESLFKVAATGIRIYLSRINQQPLEQQGKCGEGDENAYAWVEKYGFARSGLDIVRSVLFRNNVYLQGKNGDVYRVWLEIGTPMIECVQYNAPIPMPRMVRNVLLTPHQG